MLIVCPSCATSYVLAPDSLGAGGRMVRCARCKATWFAGEADNAAAEAVAATANSAGAAASSAPFSELASRAAITTAIFDHGGSRESALPGAAESAFDDRSEVTDSPPLAPAIEHVRLPDVAETDADTEDLETFAVRRQRLRARRKQARRSSRWTALLLLLLGINVALIGARAEVVRYLPQTASLFAAIGLPVNLRQLKFDDVGLSLNDEDGGLVVKGTIVSTASKPVKVPRLRFAARDGTGQEIYTWTMPPSRPALGPGEKLAFTSELRSPPAGTKDVMVRFAMDHEAIAAAGGGARNRMSDNGQ